MRPEWQQPRGGGGTAASYEPPRLRPQSDALRDIPRLSELSLYGEPRAAPEGITLPASLFDELPDGDDDACSSGEDAEWEREHDAWQAQQAQQQQYAEDSGGYGELGGDGGYAGSWGGAAAASTSQPPDSAWQLPRRPAPHSLCTEFYLHGACEHGDACSMAHGELCQASAAAPLPACCPSQSCCEHCSAQPPPGLQWQSGGPVPPCPPPPPPPSRASLPVPARSTASATHCTRTTWRRGRSTRARAPGATSDWQRALALPTLSAASAWSGFSPRLFPQSAGLGCWPATMPSACPAYGRGGRSSTGAQTWTW